jgi:hypothetical protein
MRIKISKYQISLLSLELSQFNFAAVDQKLPLAVFNAFDNKTIINNICNLIYRIFQNMGLYWRKQ